LDLELSFVFLVGVPRRGGGWGHAFAGVSGL
jgi:hypothetical protein